MNGFVRRFNSQHQMIDEIPLSQVIFRPTEAYNQQMGGIDTLVMGFLLTPAAKFDIMVNDVLRNHLFEIKTADGQGKITYTNYISLFIVFVLLSTNQTF